MIVITGAAGFIASNLARRLNQEGFRELALVDDFSRPEKRPNWEPIQHTARIDRNDFFDWIKGKERAVQFLFHLGARTDTAERDVSLFHRLNTAYAEQVWQICARHAIPLVYASSAATYGDGAYGFDDDPRIIPKLRPLNPYGESKQAFDVWALAQPDKPFFWAGLKFFNVYGPGEQHKGRMASVVYHAWRQIHESGAMRLFRSHREGIPDGGQARDFIAVQDVCEAMLHLMHTRRGPGIYNLGTGKARTFLDLVGQVFLSMGRERRIEFVDTPADIRDTYQYFTEARMDRFALTGYSRPFTPLEAGVDTYVREGLMSG